MAVPVLVFWRNLGGAVLLAPFAFKKKEWRNKSNFSAFRWSAFAGFLLCLHFIAFFTAMRYTSVAAGTALAALQPIFASIFIAFKGGKIPTRSWIGMFIAFLSLLLITGIDWGLSTRNFEGDIAAIICACLSAGYVIAGGHAQEKISTPTYATICYATCAVTALPIIAFTGYSFTSYKYKDWVLLLGLIAGAQILGHTMFNFALKRVSPAIVSMVVFFEVPVSAILAFWWLGQKPNAGIIPGIIVLLFGSGVVVWGNNSKNSLQHNPPHSIEEISAE
jgi:drug/metabolite transporter (DMT)-like permease